MSATQRWRAAPADGGVVADPPLNRSGRLVAANRLLLDTAAVRILGRPLADLRRQGCQETLAAAADYLRQDSAGIPPPYKGGGGGVPTSLILAGHQPEMFHPGVWVKNFALNGLARAHGCIPVNLVVDNDTVKSTEVRLPRRVVNDAAIPEECGGAVGLATIPFDTWAGEVPYEERRVQDEALFAGFADQVTAVQSTWDQESLLPVFWAEVRRQAERTPLLGERLAAARRTFERRWGCNNLEVPLSALCRTETFAWLACHLLFHLPDFHSIYNEAVRDYRRQHGIKSRNHPVPELVRAGDWWEAPFWGWRRGQTRRSRLMARLSSGQIELRTEAEAWPSIPRGCNVEAAVAAWRGLESGGFKARSRALTTTLFARLCISDLFIHGIGGAKYDNLTDAIIRRFFHIAPPAFLMLSATLHLPLPAFPAHADRRTLLARTLRDLQYNPQRHLPSALAADPKVAALVREKQAWIAQQPASAAVRRQRFHAIRALSAQLAAKVDEQADAARRQLACYDRQLAANAILQRRDYAFCLFPESKLRPFCQQFLEQPAGAVS